MTFNDWLNALGQVVTSFIGWLSSAINILKDNWIIMTILGIGIFYFLFNLVLDIIGKLRYNRYERIVEKSGTIGSLSNKQVKWLDQNTNKRTGEYQRR